MFHKFVDFYMVIINQILRSYAYITILLENYPKLVSYFYTYFSLSHFAHSNRQLLRFKKGWAVYARVLGLTLPIFSSTLLDRYGISPPHRHQYAYCHLIDICMHIATSKTSECISPPHRHQNVYCHLIDISMHISTSWASLNKHHAIINLAKCCTGNVSTDLQYYQSKGSDCVAWSCGTLLPTLMVLITRCHNSTQQPESLDYSFSKFKRQNFFIRVCTLCGFASRCLSSEFIKFLKLYIILEKII